MKKKVTGLIILVFIFGRTFGATEFNLTCASVAAGGGYSPNNVVAIWVTQTNGAIVKTILRYGETRKTSLSSWNVADGASVDGKMGATRSNHVAPALTATWDLKNKSGVVVPDGTYQIHFEFSEGAGSKTYIYNFAKNSTGGTRTDPGNAYFKNISIAYAPPAPANTAPVASAQSVMTAEDTAKAVILTATDAETNALTYAVVTGPAHGTLSGTAPNVTYAPATNYYGLDSFTFQASDASLTSTPATVSITVTPVNDPPVAQNQSVTNAEDTAKAITLVAADAETNALTYAVVTGPAHGVLTGSVPNLTYTPAANYNGPDSFTFNAYDGSVTGNTATVSITVTPVNDPPVAQNQSVTNVVEDTAKLITLVATDVETNALTYAIVSAPAHGVLTGIAPSVTYTPAINYYGADSFTFKANDGFTDSVPATVSITVTPVNDSPVAQNQNLQAVDGRALSITLSATDAETNALTYHLVSQPANGRLIGTPPVLTYLPRSGLNGPDSFTFNAYDGTATGNTASIFITLVFTDSNSNSIPDSWETSYGLTNGINAANADPDGDGASNYAEYMAGTDPTNKNSVLALKVPQMTGASNIVIQWSSVQNRFYAVLTATDLAGGWSTIVSNRIAAPPMNTYTGVLNQTVPVFYRIKLEP
ncbi:MAG: Ig-like domain-containing protein [Kiritimatiellales bacterium]|jgi:hypothetical protein